MEGTTAQLHLTIQTDSEPIAGYVAVPGEEPRRFNGWIELADAIEHARSANGSTAGSEPRS